MDMELICNFWKCRKPIKNKAWVTSCSHIFCLDDGDREFPRALVCPACNTNLTGMFDVVKVDTNPNDQFKAIVLAGLSPDIILDIASRAMSFWAYQVQQELAYRENQSSKLSEQRFQMEELHNQALGDLQTELNTTKAEVASQKQRSAELSEKLIDKTRQLQKVQTMYESMRRKCSMPINCYDRNNPSAARPASVDLAQAPQSTRSFEIPMTTPDFRNRGNLTRYLNGVPASVGQKHPDFSFPSGDPMNDLSHSMPTAGLIDKFADNSTMHRIGSANAFYPMLDPTGDLPFSTLDQQN